MVVDAYLEQHLKHNMVAIVGECGTLHFDYAPKGKRRGFSHGWRAKSRKSQFREIVVSLPLSWRVLWIIELLVVGCGH